ncbi:hypothetical protein L226DRAFT_526173 [Lentinus tigrinus ALCF2SS1-7]|uniref:Uncharacterized protein n=1 Tax=Lentinus tigrinus ALCF2SS1-6 TaxID=1328759 RepID=A0A5C2RX29_9APHY|nr:hypothetical protein L227DRAFT_566792 [Lentinus tigrinus ALCF2SS1-6]RPD70156.1 hypothetical protein L226DRAFT_526173 [Lentinus tigrinus ALCF2SS1-7]
MALLALKRSEFRPHPNEDGGEVYACVMLYAYGEDGVGVLCLPVGPEPEENYAWNARIQEVLHTWPQLCDLNTSQQTIISDILIGFRELSDSPDEREQYEIFTSLLRIIVADFEEVEEVDEDLQEVVQWLRATLHEDAFTIYQDAAIQTEA